MATILGTFTWNATGTTDPWNTTADWTPAGGSAAVAFAGTSANEEIFVLPANASPYAISITSANQPAGGVVAGAVTIGSNATVNIGSGASLRSSQLAVTSGPGGTLTMTGGTINMSGGTLTYYTTTVGSGSKIFGYGLFNTPSVTGGTPSLTTSGTGKVVADGGTLDIKGLQTMSLSGSFAIDGASSGSVLFLDGNYTTMAAGTTVDFQNLDGTFEMSGANGFVTAGSALTFNATLNNVKVGSASGASTGASVIELTGQTPVSTKIVGSKLEIVTAAVTYIWNTNGSFAGDTLNSTVSGGNAFIWVDTQPCYLAGTRVLTERGEVAVEALVEGDRIVTLEGDARVLRPVVWIGQRRLELRQHPQPNLVAPIRIRQDAFGHRLPHRDLLVSPDHCLFVGGRLIPAKLLINDMTVVQEREVAAVHYYHVELDRHAVMLAEGLPAESYLDTGNRAMFANAGLALVLHPDFAVNTHLKCWETDACAPLTVAPDAVKPVWQSLADRAETLGYQRDEYETTTDPDLHLIADGRVIRPLAAQGDRYVFTLPAGAAAVRLASRASVPSQFEAYLDDWRQLGVAVRRILVRDAAGVLEIAADHPSLSDGWYQLESDDAAMWRWMNGDALLPIAATDGPAIVEVHVGIAMKHVVAPVNDARLAA
jgi:hypothetical protein